ncbi:SUMF1/EgtB/PvdO family nonheme iron enzyme [Nitrosomonas sp.]|uniref:SUMF1/EgtB/PvdO family nonheme iron enzyme n=1 Tax=Nitrosomonas sp. TaxID=42353 RepID=UPI00207F3EC8|nr:SUMF1/EgtB/PvdO family nonheme iron enzyme [Nitrosomonas sp.]GJL75726.1 MAG: hypothetical protein NMNS02_18320 [Nitrosomonas sp.]
MSWKKQLVDVVFFSGLGNVLAKVLPEHWQRRVNERLNDFNPYSVIADNHDLMRAARLAWIKAALEVLDAAKESAQSSGRAFNQKNDILRFEAHARKKLYEIRSAALDRRPDPGVTAIDRHLKLIMQGTSEFVAPDEKSTLDQPLTLDFGKILAGITDWPVNEIPAMFIQIARDGLPTVDQGATRTFGELVFAAFAEILKSPDQYRQAFPEFVIATQNAAQKLTEEILTTTRGIDEKVDALIVQADALTIFQKGAQAYLDMLPRLLEGQAQLEALALSTQREVQAVKADTEEIKDFLQSITQTAKSNPAASEEEMLAAYRKLLDQLGQREFKQLLDTVPDSLSVYRAQCIARWAQPRFAIDKQFTPLTLLLDQGEDHEGERYQRNTERYDLREILDAVDTGTEPVIIVTGGPGSGKSTLLRRLELDLASSALRSEDARAPLTMFLPLNDFGDKNSFPKPVDWIKEYWAQKIKFLPDFETVYRRPLILLLDGLNEMPHMDRADYDDRLAAWKNFLNNLALHHPSVRVIFSCRTLDYGSKLTTKDLPRVPQVEIQPLTSEQVQNFLMVYSPDNAQQLWHQLKDSPQLDLYRSPYYLKLLIEQASDGRIPEGRAALFTGFVRAMLKREINAGNPRLHGNALLLTARDLQCIGQWRSANELPRRGQLFNALAAFAFQLQTQRNDGDTGNTGNKMQVRIDFDDALDYLSAQIPDEPQRENLLNAAVDLQILDMPGDDVLFVHQLLQEYFAARHLAEAVNKTKNAEGLTAFANLASVAWRETDITPSVQAWLETLPRSGTLPDLPTTGWEETVMLAAAMVDVPDDFLRVLAEVNLPLAGRCAAQPDVKVSDGLCHDLQQKLVERSRDPKADLRARIHAGDALGGLGDPRFESRQGSLGRYLLPPMITIAGGTYLIGSDEGLEEDEAPRHDVELAPFALAQFPVTNAEFKYFIDAGGYDDERWWDTPQAQCWQRGEGTGEASRENWRYWRDRFKNEAAYFKQFVDEQAWTEDRIQQWRDFILMDDEAFEAMLKNQWPDQRFALPMFWADPKFNSPNQPVVGICWFEARAYCAWLRAQTGQSYRLPTEVEWEAAASGKAGRRYAWGDTLDETRCNIADTQWRCTTPVGVFPSGDTPPSASESGIVDLLGNVWEWTGSGYQAYPYRADDGREAVDGDTRRVLRGGSWINYGWYCRSADRLHYDPSGRNSLTGFRLARGH